MLGSLRHSIDKVGLTTSFCSHVAFSSVSLLLSKENETRY